MNVGLERPADDVEILVFRVVFTATNKTICTKSVTSASPNCEPEEVIANLLAPWPDLVVPGAYTWRLAMVHPSRKQAREPELCQPTYIIIPAALPVLRRRPHCLVEVVWGHQSWIAAIAMPRWVNVYSCYALLRGLCGPVLEHSCDAWLNEVRMTTELAECQNGSFFHFIIDWRISDCIVDDLQSALTCRLYVAHLPVQCLNDDQRLISVFVPQGLTCYTGILGRSH